MIEKKIVYETFFTFNSFSGAAEIFVGYSALQLSLYFISLYYIRKTEKYVVRLPDFYLIGAFTFFLSFLLIWNEDDYFFSPNLYTPNFNLVIANDYLSFISKEVICFSVGVFFLSSKFSKTEPSLSNSFEYTTFILTCSLGSLLLCSANDLLTSYLALELQSISLYLMACSKRNSNYSVESGLKYFIIGSFSSSFFILGASLIYLRCGTVGFVELKTTLTLWFSSVDGTSVDPDLLELGFFLLVFSLLIKLAAAPFHLWSIDVYESSPTSTTYFFTIIPRFSLFILLVRVLYSTSAILFFPLITTLCLIISIVSLYLGALGGIEQRKLKSLLAYSALNHTGYALLAFSTGLTNSVVLMLYYLFFYTISNLCFWSVFMFLKQKTGNYKGKSNKELGDLVLLWKSNPALAVILSVPLFSLAGLPPLAGFLVKIGTFLTLIQSTAYFLAAVGVLLSLISTFYYLRLIKIIFFENNLVGKLYHPVTSNKALIITSLTALLALLFIKPSLVYLVAVKSYLTLL